MQLQKHLNLRNTLGALGFLFALFSLSTIATSENTPPLETKQVALNFASLLAIQGTELEETLSQIDDAWQPSFASMTLDVLSLSRRSAVRNQLIEILENNTGQQFGADMDAWFNWIWNQDEVAHTHYAQFKSLLFGLVDPKFRQYFNDQFERIIRLDEVRWGGVVQDGIPPLRRPKMLPASKANYLDDSDVVFGIQINGDTRAYPKRILAWHEMFVDTVGGVPFAGVYCTLCGAVILYETQQGDTQFNMGTSGFLYRSNKLMYDKATQSLWSTTRGEPVIGPLVGQGIRLQRSFLVTTTWGEWRKRHPKTMVLSLDTGYKRDYGEGVAYRNYFATDELMFKVPKLDARLNNKDEILALTFPDLTDNTLAIDANFLRENPLYQDQLATQRLLVLTDPSGANRVYDAGEYTFEAYDQERTVTDNKGVVWDLTEPALTASDGTQLKRLPAHRAFWFGWVAVHQDTRLVK